MAKRKLSTLKAIYFDAVGTILHPRPNASLVYESIGRRYGSRRTAADISYRFQHALLRQDAIDRQAGFRTDEQRELLRWREIVAEVLDDVADHEVCFRALHQHFGQPEAWHCELGLSTMLKLLAESGLRLGLASNFDSRLRTVLAGFPPLQELALVAISSEIGWRKPA